MSDPHAGLLVGPPVREWRARRLSMANVYYVVCLLLGVASVVAGVWFLITRSAPVTAAVWTLLVGVVFVVVGAFCLIVPARRVIETADGHFHFLARNRTLEVGPGELISISMWMLDTGRLMPLTVKATNGRAFVAIRLTNIADLWTGLAQANPGARLANPSPWSWRDDDGISFRLNKAKGQRPSDRPERFF